MESAWGQLPVIACRQDPLCRRVMLGAKAEYCATQKPRCPRLEPGRGIDVTNRETRESVCSFVRGLNFLTDTSTCAHVVSVLASPRTDVL